MAEGKGLRERWHSKQLWKSVGKAGYPLYANRERRAQETRTVICLAPLCTDLGDWLFCEAQRLFHAKMQLLASRPGNIISVLTMRIQSIGLADRFQLENQMTAPVVEWLRSQGLSVKREFVVPWGICDLVGLKFNRARVRRRLSYGQRYPLGSSLGLLILSKIPDVESGTTITPCKLRRDSFGFLSEEVFENELRRLLRLKFVTNPKGQRFQKLNGWAPLHESIVAVELKLSRVSEALAQASANRTFADESYVAMPAGLAYRLAEGGRAEEFKREGVGLLAVFPGSCERVLCGNSVPGTTDAVLQAHCVERFWRTRDRSS